MSEKGFRKRVMLDFVLERWAKCSLEEQGNNEIKRAKAFQAKDAALFFLEQVSNNWDFIWGQANGDWQAGNKIR